MMRYFLAFFGLIVLTTCEKVDINRIDNLNNGKIDIIGHAGSGFQSLINPLPSNSFTSIKKAIDGMNADGIEVDVKVSIDSIPVLFHDNVLEMGSNCVGCPENYTGAELVKCKYKNYYGSLAGEDQYLISFQQMINHFKGRSKLPHIYTSPKIPSVCTTDPAFINKYAKVITKIIQDNKAHNWISVYDSDIKGLNKIKELDPNINLILNAYDFDFALSDCITNNYSEMVIENTNITKEQVKIAHQHNKKVTIWGVLRKNEIMEAIEKHPDALMTDNIQLTQELLRK